MKKLNSLWIFAGLALAAAGCGGGEATAEQVEPPPTIPIDIDISQFETADAGEPVLPVAGVPLDLYQSSATMTPTAARRDPFALLAMEGVFEKNQQRERMVSEVEGGFWPVYYEEPPRQREEIEITEPQPRRRLAGIVLSPTGVGALIEMEDGRTYEVRPGSRIPNSEWVVVSVDQDKAVLRRGGNRLPKVIIVTLEPGTRAPAGGGGAGGTGGGGRPGIGTSGSGGSPEQGGSGVGPSQGAGL